MAKAKWFRIRTVGIHMIVLVLVLSVMSCSDERPPDTVQPTSGAESPQTAEPAAPAGQGQQSSEGDMDTMTALQYRDGLAPEGWKLYDYGGMA